MTISEFFEYLADEYEGYLSYPEGDPVTVTVEEVEITNPDGSNALDDLPPPPSLESGVEVVGFTIDGMDIDLG